MSGKINRAKAFAATGVTLMDRVQGNGGANITQVSITSIAFSVDSYPDADSAEVASGGTLVASGTLVKTTVVFDTLQTAAPWDSGVDSAGYNFRYDSPATHRPTGPKWHRYEIVFTPTSGAAFALVWIVETLSMQV